MSGDFSEIMQLAADLDAGGESLPKHVRKAVKATALDVKKGAQETVRKRNGLGHAASAISYDTKSSGGSADAEIGYDKGKGAGPLGNLIEFGAPGAKAHMLRKGRNVPVPGNKSRPLPPSHDLANALVANEDSFKAKLLDAVNDSLAEADL